MGNSLAGDSKLNFFPTQQFETHRLLGLLGRIDIDYYKKNYLKELYTKEGIYQELGMRALDNQIKIECVYFDYWLQTKQYDFIKNFCEYNIGNHNNFPTVICDPFAGDSKWLTSFSELMDRKDTSNNYILVANELEKTRFDSFKDNPDIYDKYNLTFEELNLGKNVISLMLYNPPYGATNDSGKNIRNVKHYLNMILDRQILYNPLTSKDYKTGYMVFVIRKDDFLDSLDILCKNFDILKNAIYKVNPEEYAKYKQYVFVAHLKRHPYDLTNVNQAMDYQNEYNKIKEIIESEPEFNLRMYNTYQMMNYPYIDYDTAKENNRYIEVSNSYASKKDSIWKWVKDITELKNLGEEKLTIPKPLKLGETANILAAGMINGEIDLDGKGKHVVIGGTKSIQKTETNSYKDDNGEKVTETKVIKLSLPYLNILCSENGELKIKELGDSE